jgi:pimeloyl-ACP methyl ester carboxylesterase
LGFAEYGPQSGRPVFHCHGSASSRLERPASESILHELDIRFISVDRPGHGLSDFQVGRRLLDWPGDISQLADHLGLDHFYILGYSGGGPHALACAHQLPDRVISGAAVSSVAPMGRPGALSGMPLPNRLLAWSARSFPWLTRLVRAFMRRVVMGDPETGGRQLMASIPESDRAILDSPEVTEAFVSTVQEGFLQGSRAVAHDDVLINRDWGFDPAGIEVRIDIWHGEADVNVPVHAARYLADQIPDNRLTLIPNAGHFMVMTRWEEILSALVSASQ